MAREMESERLLNKRIEKKKFQIEKEKLQHSRDFKEVTLAITLLAGVAAFLLKLIDYFNNTVNYSSQSLIYFIASLLLFELSVIFSFLILKGYLLSTKNGETEWEYKTSFLFKNIFINPIAWMIILAISLSLDYYTKDLREKFYYKYIFYILSILIGSLYVYLYYIFFNIQKMEIKPFWKSLKACLLVIIIFPVLFNIFYIGPTHLLSGYYSIEVFPQSNIYYNDILTFTEIVGKVHNFY